MTDLKNPRWIYTKGFLFLLAGFLSAGLLIAEAPHWKVVLLLAIAIWCFSRFYYFAFYVIQHYVDDQFRFSGLWDFMKYLIRRK